MYFTQYKYKYIIIFIYQANQLASIKFKIVKVSNVNFAI